MTTLDSAKNEILGFLRESLSGLTASPGDLTPPPDNVEADLAFGCFPAAKLMKKSPAAIAEELAGKFAPSALVAECVAVGPYLNFRFNRAAFSQALVREIMDAPDQWGHSQSKEKEAVMIEYAQPNTHKELHVGHLRNLALGLAVVNLWQAVGREVVPTCYIGDIGAHVAKCLWCLKKFHAEEVSEPPADKGAWLGRIYSEATKRIDEDESLKEEVAEVQRKLEARDPEWDELWRKTREWSLEEFRRVYDELGVKLDRWYFESEVEEAGKQMARSMLERGLAQEGERGALIVDLEDEGLGIALILKSDGSALYMTKELALAQLKFLEYDNIGYSIHVVDSRQSLYFRQFFAILRRLGFDKKLTHLSYEFVTLKEGAMSSRSGNVVTYQSFRDEVLARTKAETEKRHAEDWDEERIRQTSWAIAEGAMKFGMLKQDPDKPIVFDIEQAVSFDGFTGPYLQYAHARLASILKKAKWSGAAGVDEAAGAVSAAEAAGADAVAGADNQDEFAVLAVAARFPETVQVAAHHNKPSLLAQYLFDLAQAISRFYRDVPVLNAESKEDRERRLRITESLRLTLERGLACLGIKAPTEM